MADEYWSRFASPVSRLVRFFEKSRDEWKAKYGELLRLVETSEADRPADLDLRRPASCGQAG